MSSEDEDEENEDEEDINISSEGFSDVAPSDGETPSQEDVLILEDSEELDILNNDLTAQGEQRPVTDAISTLINSRFRCSLSAELVKEYQNEFPVPGNCENLQVPTVNTPI